MTQIQNSAHKMKMSTVPFVGDILPEAGAMVVSEHDGHIYYADKYGWHKGDTIYSIFTLFVKYTDTQLDFRLALAVGKTVTIHWGDGSTTDVAGAGGTVFVNEVSAYSEPGEYYFYLTGDVDTIERVRSISENMVVGSISLWGDMSIMSRVVMQDTKLYGDIATFEKITTLALLGLRGANVTGDVATLSGQPDLFEIDLQDTNAYGDIGALAGLLAMKYVNIYNTSIRGDLSKFGAITELLTIFAFNSACTWETTDPANSAMTTLDMTDCKLLSRYVDNALISMADGGVADCTINLGGNNKPRTAASDAAKTTLETAGCTVTVNE